MILSKKFRFESAHRLAKEYKGKCAQIHGHSWRGELHINCSQLNEFGMGLDFDHLKEFATKMEDHLDHKLLLYKHDKPLIELCHSLDYAYVTFDDNPTSEVIASYIFGQASTHFKSRFPTLSIASVVIEETCTTRCICTG